MSKNEVGLASDSIFCPEFSSGGSHINSHRAQTHLEIYTLQLQPTLKGKPDKLTYWLGPSLSSSNFMLLREEYKASNG